MSVSATYLLCELIQHACADSCSVSAEDVLLSLFYLPVIFVPGSHQEVRSSHQPAEKCMDCSHNVHQQVLPLRAIASL